MEEELHKKGDFCDAHFIFVTSLCLLSIAIIIWREQDAPKTI